MVNAARGAGRRRERGRESFPTACIMGVLLALISGAALLPLLSLFLLRSNDPARLAGTTSYALGLLLPLLGGYFGARRRGHGGALVGLSIAIVTVFIFLAVALTLSGGALSGAAIPLYGGMLLAGTFGGALATRRRKRRRR